MTTAIERVERLVASGVVELLWKAGHDISARDIEAVLTLAKKAALKGMEEWTPDQQRVLWERGVKCVCWAERAADVVASAKPKKKPARKGRR